MRFAPRSPRRATSAPAVRGVPRINRSYHGHSFSYGVARLMQAFVVGRQAVTAAEAEAWLQEFNALEQQGAYFFCLTPILTEAVKVA
jgi:hypothetical protein